MWLFPPQHVKQFLLSSDPLSEWAIIYLNCLYGGKLGSFRIFSYYTQCCYEWLFMCILYILSPACASISLGQIIECRMNGRCVFHVRASYEFEHLTCLPCVEDGASALIHLYTYQHWTHTWALGGLAIYPSLCSASFLFFSPAGPKRQQGGGDCWWESPQEGGAREMASSWSPNSGLFPDWFLPASQLPWVCAPPALPERNRYAPCGHMGASP